MAICLRNGAEGTRANANSASGVEVLPDARTGARDFCAVLRELEPSTER